MKKNSIINETAYSILSFENDNTFNNEFRLVKTLKPSLENGSKILKKEFLLLKEIKNAVTLTPVQINPNGSMYYNDRISGSVYGARSQFSDEISFFITISISILNAIKIIHSLGIMLTNLNPDTILLTLENEVKLANFEQALFDTTHCHIDISNFTNHEKKYIAPEIKSNSGFDNRCDIYSLGVVFLKLLGHHNKYKSLDLILKKMSSHLPQFRYQSISGVLADFKECQAQLTHNQKISFFLPGQWDKPDRLLFGGELYGREREIDTIVNTINQCLLSQLQVISIKGDSGIGKTKLVQHCLSVFEKNEFRLISFKSDEETQANPYMAIRHIISHYLPNFEYDKHGFSMILNQFMAKLLNEARPLILFFDDAQWMDHDSMALIHRLLNQLNSQKITLIFAARSQHFHSEWITPTLVELGSLSETEVNDFLAETFYMDPNTTQKIASVIYQKTLGNPFYIRQLLESLYTRKIIFFDDAQNQWQWELDRIQQEEISDNFVNLLETNINSLAPDTLHLLRIAAHIGTQFDLELLSQVSGQSRLHITLHFWSALKSHYIYCLSPEPITDFTYIEAINVEYRFSHDRLRAAFQTVSSTPSSEHIHLTIAQQIIALYTNKKQNELLFSLTNHLSIAKQIIPQSLFLYTTKLSFRAGQKAYTTVAYKAAFHYFEMACHFFEKSHTTEHDNLSFQIKLRLAETLFLTGHISKSEALFNSLSTQYYAQNRLVNIHQKQIDLYTSSGHYRQAINIGLKSLSQFGVHYRYHQSKYKIVWDLLKIYYIKRSFTNIDLTTLPQNNQLSITYQMALISTLIQPAYFLNKLLCIRLILKITALSLTSGISKYSYFSFVCYGFIIGYLFHKWRFAYEFGKASIENDTLHQNSTVRCRLIEIFGTFTLHWIKPYTDCLTYLEESKTLALEIGDLFCLMLSFVNIIGIHLLIGSPLDTINLQKPNCINLFSSHFDWIWEKKYFLETQFIHYLQEPMPTEYLGHSFDFDIDLSEDSFSTKSILLHVALFSAWNAVLFHNSQLRHKCLQNFNKFRHSAQGLFFIPDVYFFEALILLDASGSCNPLRRRLNMKIINQNIKKFKSWSVDCPENYAGKWNLLLAKKFEVAQQYLKAEKSYLKAIHQFQSNNMLHHLALSYEYMAQMKFSCQQYNDAKMYLDQAIQTYGEWGALRKVSHMQSLKIYAHFYL